MQIWPIVIFVVFTMGWMIYVAMLKFFEIQKTVEVLNKFRGKKIYNVSSRAKFKGTDAQSGEQVNGNGVLVLTDQELYFEMWFPKKMNRIMTSDIINIETAEGINGEGKKQPGVKITFNNKEGKSHSSVIHSKGAPNLQRRLEQLTKKGDE